MSIVPKQCVSKFTAASRGLRCYCTPLVCIATGVDFHSDLGSRSSPTTSEAYRVHPIVDPTKFWEGVGDAKTAMETTTEICQH